MAAPQTSGAAALLVGQAQKTGLKVTPRSLTQALELSARRLPGYAWYEQGHGLIQVDLAWNTLQQVAKEKTPDLVSFGKARSGVAATGLYARDFTATESDARWVIGNRDYWRTNLDLSYLPGSGLSISGPAAVSLPGLQRKQIPLQFSYDAKRPGIYDALIQARVPGQRSYAAEYLATVIVPHTFDPAKGNLITGITGNLSPARYGRHFVQVPAGTAELKVTLTVPNKAGRVRVMPYTPDGLPYGTGTPWAGAPEAPESQVLTIPNPQPGVWELDTYASHGGMNYGLVENKYNIDVAARGVYAKPSRIDLAPFFGMEQKRSVTFANYYGDIDAVITGAGFAQPKSERMTVEQNGYQDMFFDVAAGTALLRAGFSGVDDLGADLSIGLYYNDPKLGGWTVVGTTHGTRQSKTVELLNPAPGKYAVEIAGKQIPSGKTGLTFSTTVVAGGTGLKVPQGTTPRAFGTKWSSELTALLPGNPGAYVGAVTLTDAKTGQVLTVVPVEIR